MAGKKDQSSAVSSVSGIATDLSRRTEATSFSVPDDGRVVTISTNPRRRPNNNNTTAADQLASASQTSLLIEYFESGKKDKSKNVRVKVTPSRRSKSKGAGGDGSRLTTSDDVRSHRSTNSPNILGEVLEGRRRDSGNLNDGMSSPSFVSDNSVQPLNIGIKGQNRGSPSSIASRDIELGSDTARARTRANVRAASKARKEDYYGLKTTPSGGVRSRSISRESYLTEDGGLKPVAAKLSRRRSRSLSQDRLSPNDAAKSGEKQRKGQNRGYEPGDRYRKGRSRSRSHSRDRSGDSYDPKNDLKKGENGLTKKGESNVTYDPNMLDLVEDAIKRIIQPQIQELKNKQTNEAVFNAHTSEISGTTAPKFGGQLNKPFKISSMPDVKPMVVFTPDFDRGKGQGFVVAKAHDSKDSLVSNSDVRHDPLPLFYGRKSFMDSGVADSMSNMSEKSDATSRAPGFGPTFKNTGRTLHSEVGEGERDEIVPLSFNSDVSTNVPRGRPDALDIPTWGGLDPPATRQSLPAQSGLPYPRKGTDTEMPRTGGTPNQQDSNYLRSRAASVSSMSSLPTDVQNNRREKAGKQRRNSREVDDYLDHAQSSQNLANSLGASTKYETTELGASNNLTDDRSLLSIGDMTDVQSTNLAQQRRKGDSLVDEDGYTVDGSHLNGGSNLDVGGSSLLPPQSERVFRDDESNFTQDYDEYHSDLSERNPNNPHNTLNQPSNANPAVQAFFAEQRQLVEQEAMLVGAQHGGYQSHLDKGQDVLGLGANPSFCSTPVVGHSHQASLVDAVSNRSLGVHSTTQPQMLASAVPTSRSPMPEIGHYGPDDDEITNPSEIQGPGPQNWEMEGMTQGQQLANIATKSARGTTTSPGGKDEGYMSAAHVFSSGMASPMNTPGPINHLDGIDALDNASDYDAPVNFDYRLSMGQSHGMPSPLYDSATGRGIENIKSKDIIALMDHLTVRDAQRNARDTEILVSLVRSAAEMRNYFEDLKKQLDDKSKEIITEVDKSTERHVNRIQGPRPLPPSAPRARKAIEEDEQTKKVNVFKRAMKGLGGKSNGDLQRIEGMLETLLAEMDALKGNHEFYQQSMSQTLDNIKKESQDKSIDGTDQQGYPMATPQTTNVNQQQQQLLGPNQGYMDIHYNHNISPIPEGSITPTLDAPVIEPNSRTPPLISDVTSPKDKKRDPKVSRWSETTASTGIRSFFTRGKKRDSGDNSRGGQSDSFDDWYGDRGHQDGDAMPERSNRISLDLQQPVPRPPLPHQRLEMSAQDYTPNSAPISPTSYKSNGSFNKYPYGSSNQPYGTTQPLAAMPMTPEGYTLSGGESYGGVKDGEEKPKKERRKKDRSSREYDPEKEARRAARRERKEQERLAREAAEQQAEGNPTRNASTASKLNGPRPIGNTYGDYQEPLVDGNSGSRRHRSSRMSTGENY